MTCEVCGNDPVADARARDRQHEIKRQYRRALYLACGGDKEKVKRMMSRAEDEMCQVPPNTVLRPSSNELGEAIDAAIEMIERLEAAEKSDAESIAMYRKARDERDALRAALQHEADCLEAANAKIEALRAKIPEMEKQEPARLVTPTAYRWRYRGAVKWQYGELTEECARLAKEHNHEVQSLYALPGAQAQPAPSVLEGWPTEEMTTAFARVFNVRDQSGTFTPAFRAALAAAPEAKQ